MKYLRLLLTMLASALQVFAFAARGEYVTSTDGINALIIEDNEDAMRSDKQNLKADANAIYGDMRNAWLKIIEKYG